MTKMISLISFKKWDWPKNMLLVKNQQFQCNQAGIKAT